MNAKKQKNKTKHKQRNKYDTSKIYTVLYFFSKYFNQYMILTIFVIKTIKLFVDFN